MSNGAGVELNGGEGAAEALYHMRVKIGTGVSVWISGDVSGAECVIAEPNVGGF